MTTHQNDQQKGGIARPPVPLADVLKALGDPVRLEIMRQAAAGGGSVACTTLESTLEVSKSTISYHVKALHHAGLLSISRQGRFFHYEIRHGALEASIPGFTDHLRTLKETDQ